MDDRPELGPLGGLLPGEGPRGHRADVPGIRGRSRGVAGKPEIIAEASFHYAFANTVSREESDAAYDRLHIPAPGNWVWAYGLIANFKPGHQETWVDYDLDDRAPLLFIMGGKDHLMPPSVIRSNAKKYRNSSTSASTR